MTSSPSALAEYETLLLDLTDSGVLTVTLNRPEARNALNLVALQELGDLWGRLPYRKDVRAVLVTGEGAGFCAGGDVAGMASGEFDLVDITVGPLATNVWRGYSSVPQPVVAAVNGDAVGAGFALALLADIVLVAEHARMGDPHVKLGLVASGAGILVPSIGMHRASELLLTGDLISAARAMELGIVSEVLPADQLLARARERTEKMAALPREAVQWTKRGLRMVSHRIWDIGWHAEMALEALSAQTDEHAAAAERFRSRRSS